MAKTGSHRITWPQYAFYFGCFGGTDDDEGVGWGHFGFGGGDGCGVLRVLRKMGWGWIGWFMVDKNGGGILVDMMCVGEV